MAFMVMIKAVAIGATSVGASAASTSAGPISASRALAATSMASTEKVIAFCISVHIKSARADVASIPAWASCATATSTASSASSASLPSTLAAPSATIAGRAKRKMACTRGALESRSPRRAPAGLITATAVEAIPFGTVHSGGASGTRGTSSASAAGCSTVTRAQERYVRQSGCLLAHEGRPRRTGHAESSCVEDSIRTNPFVRSGRASTLDPTRAASGAAGLASARQRVLFEVRTSE